MYYTLYCTHSSPCTALTPHLHHMPCMQVVDMSDIIVLAVKPQVVTEVLQEVRGRLVGDKVVVSIAAGITLSM